jgi:intron-binding protein aquarius
MGMPLTSSPFTCVQEVDLVREQVQRLVSLPIWQHLVPSRLQDELSAVTKLRKYWNIIQKRDKQADPATMEK